MTTTTAPCPPTAGATVEPEHWADTRYSYTAAEQLAPHLRPGGAVRMAMLLHLAQHPEGVSETGLELVAIGACGPHQARPDDDDMRVMCGHLAADGLLAAEPGNGTRVLYFSPPARKAARQRRLHGYTLPALIQPARVTS